MYTSRTAIAATITLHSGGRENVLSGGGGEGMEGVGHGTSPAVCASRTAIAATITLPQNGRCPWDALGLKMQFGKAQMQQIYRMPSVPPCCTLWPSVKPPPLAPAPAHPAPKGDPDPERVGAPTEEDTEYWVRTQPGIG